MDPNGNQLSAKPNTNGHVLEVDCTLTQNVIASLQYTDFTKFNGLTSNIDGIGRKPRAQYIRLSETGTRLSQPELVPINHRNFMALGLDKIGL